MQNGENYEFECRLRRADGVYRWWLIRSAPFLTGNGVIHKWYGTCTDIEYIKQTETSLRETNQYLDNLINYANAPIIVWDPQFKITRFNHAFESLTGRVASEVVGQSLEILFPPMQVDGSMTLIKKTLTGERMESVEIAIQNRDGPVHTLLWNTSNTFCPGQNDPAGHNCARA